MALNWTMLDQKRLPVPLPDEINILTINDGAEVILTIPDSGGPKRLKETGRIHLTDHRLIFVAPPNPTFDSLSVPLASIVSTSYEQPVFGSNYLTFEIKPTPDGGLSAGTKAEIRLKDQGIFQFVSSLEKSRERAIYMKRQMESEMDTLPTYDSRSADRTPEPRASSSNVPLPTPGELPPSYDA